MSASPDTITKGHSQVKADNVDGAFPVSDPLGHLGVEAQQLKTQLQLAKKRDEEDKKVAGDLKNVVEAKSWWTCRSRNDKDGLVTQLQLELQTLAGALESKNELVSQLQFDLEKANNQITVMANPESQLCNYRCSQVQKLQRAWRAKLMWSRNVRQHAEQRKAAQRATTLRRITQFQFRWRARQQRLQQHRVSCGALRVASCRPLTKYDVVFSFQSLAEFIATGKVEFLQSAESSFNMATVANRCRIVAVVGLFDKGKTFIINKLLGLNLPSGKIFSTKGLSFLWVPERRMLVLDSAGVQSTVSYRAQNVQPIHDAQTTESLVFEMISRIAHSVIFVVNDLTWFEQKYVAMLHQKYVQRGQSKELIVVHNLRTTEFVREANDLFARQITQCYDGMESHLGPGLRFTADEGDGVPPIEHVGICHDGSAAGEKFNEENYKWLLQMVEVNDKLGSNIKLPELLRDELVRLLPVFVNLEALEEVQGNGNNAMLEQPLVVEFEKVEPISTTSKDGYDVVGRLVMRDPRRVVMKTRGVLDSLGESISVDMSFVPIVNVFDNANQRVIQVECPGVAEDDIDLDRLPNGIKIAIEKHPPIDEASVHAHPHYNGGKIRQHTGRWERDFSFDVAEGNFVIPMTGALYNVSNGVLTVVLDRMYDTKLKPSRRTTASSSVPAPGDQSPKSSVANDDSFSLISIATQ